ncbi:MAG: hypothetical protein ACR2GP_03265 [Burkholderiaceae bacterium]
MNTNLQNRLAKLETRFAPAAGPMLFFIRFVSPERDSDPRYATCGGERFERCGDESVHDFQTRIKSALAKREQLGGAHLVLLVDEIDAAL